MNKLYLKILLLTLCFTRSYSARKELLAGFGEITDRKSKKTTTEEPTSSDSDESYEYSSSSSSEESYDSSDQSRDEYEEVTSSGELEETHRDRSQSFVLPEEYLLGISDKPNCFLAESQVEDGYMNGLGGCCRRHPFNNNYRENLCSCSEYFYEDEDSVCRPVSSAAKTVFNLRFVVYVVVCYVIRMMFYPNEIILWE